MSGNPGGPGPDMEPYVQLTLALMNTGDDLEAQKALLEDPANAPLVNSTLIELLTDNALHRLVEKKDEPEEVKLAFRLLAMAYLVSQHTKLLLPDWATELMQNLADETSNDE